MKILFLAFFSTCSLFGFCQTVIPDANFEQELIDLGLDTGVPDGIVPTAAIDTLTELEIINGSIVTLDGIEDFTSLETFKCSCFSIPVLDLSQNESLINLNFWNGSALPSVLTSVALPDSIESLDLSNHKLITNLNLTTLPNLVSLKLFENDMTGINISQNPELEEIDLWSNDLTSLDLTQNPNLKSLNVRSNDLSSLDISQNTLLKTVRCDLNSLTSLDVSFNDSLINLFCGFNALSTLDVSNNTELKFLSCPDNTISILDLTSNDSLTNLNCSWNLLTEIPFGNIEQMISIYCADNQLTTLDISPCTEIVVFDCRSNQITSLVLPPVSNLVQFFCAFNLITELDLSMMSTSWKRLECQNNLLNCLKLAPSNNVDIFIASNNPNLNCLEIPGGNAPTGSWSTTISIDPQMSFNSSCGNPCVTSIEELQNSEKKLLQITDLMGREIHDAVDVSNQVLIYIYDDGSIERVFMAGL